MSNNKHNEESKLHEQAADSPEVEDILNDTTSDTETADITEDEADAMMKQVADLTAALEKEKKEYLYLRADFDNYRKRTLKDREELLKNAAEKVLKGLLPIVDDFERGLQATKDAENAEGVREGMELIYNKLLKYLADNGVTPIESTASRSTPTSTKPSQPYPHPAKTSRVRLSTLPPEAICSTTKSCATQK